MLSKIPFVCLLSFACVSVASAEDAKKSNVQYAIVIHGGAGGVPSLPDWQKNRPEVLEAALTTGETMLKSGRSSLDTVEAVVRILEDSPYFNAGRGAVFNAAATHELDATIMDGRDRSVGAVGGVRTIKNPISLARRVMTKTRHILLATEGAEQFADGFADDPMIERVPNDYFSTEYRRAQLDKAQKELRHQDRDKMGTVGCVALDMQGNLAAATSTGGLNNKKFGRLGDSPIPGAGTYADNATCAVSCTGVGEDFIRGAIAYDMSARVKYQGQTIEEAAASILAERTPDDELYQVRGGIIAVSRDGSIVMQFNTEGMARAAADSTGRREVHPAE